MHEATVGTNEFPLTGMKLQQNKEKELMEKTSKEVMNENKNQKNEKNLIKD